MAICINGLFRSGRGTKTELVAWPLPSRVPKIRIGGAHKGQKCYITPAVSGVPNKGDKIKVGPQVGGNATSPLHSPGSPKKWGQNQNWWGPQVVGNATSPLHSRGSPTKGTKSKWAHKWAEMLHHPCILGGPQQRGQNQSGPTSGRKCYITPAFSAVPNEMGTKSELAGPTSGQKCYITPAFSGNPKERGDKIRIGGAHKWAEMLHHPCILGGPQQRGQNQSGPTSGRKCYITPAFSGIPNERGTKSELDA